MNDIFKADGRPVLIGSLPLEDHEQAVDLVFQHTPEIPAGCSCQFMKRS